MPGQQQIFAGSVEDAPKDYTVGSNVSLIPRAVNALFTDNGAAEPWLPAVVLISDSGHVIARAVDQGVTVTAGSGAEVSWFPGVKHSAAGAVAAPVGWMTLALDIDGGDSEFFVPDNTVTSVEFFHQGTSVSSSLMQGRTGPGVSYDGILLRNTDYLYFVQSSLLWHLSGFSQYGIIEGPSPDYTGNTITGAVSNHGEQPAATTDGSLVFLGDGLWSVDYKTYQPGTVPATITLDAFQTSGVDQGVLKANLTVIAYKVY